MKSFVKVSAILGLTPAFSYATNKQICDFVDSHSLFLSSVQEMYIPSNESKSLSLINLSSPVFKPFISLECSSNGSGKVKVSTKGFAGEKNNFEFEFVDEQTRLTFSGCALPHPSNSQYTSFSFTNQSDSLMIIKCELKKKQKD